MEISLVIPCYNCSASIHELTPRLVATLDAMHLDYEIILVNDYSPDDSWEVLSSLARNSDRIIAINLMKNMGQHSATLAGMAQAQGEVIITMDDDLQHLPEDIPKLYEELLKDPSLDIVVGYVEDKKHSLFRNLGSKMQHFIRKLIFPGASRLNITTFRALRADLSKLIISHKQSNPRILLIVFTITSHIGYIKLKHENRKYGKSGYTLSQLIELTIIPIIYYSSLPLRLVSFLGITVSGLSFITAIYYIMRYLMGGIVPGFTTLTLMILFSTGLILFSFGIVGEYLSRILQQQTMPESIPIREIVRKNSSEFHS